MEYFLGALTIIGLVAFFGFLLYCFEEGQFFRISVLLAGGVFALAVFTDWAVPFANQHINWTDVIKIYLPLWLVVGLVVSTLTWFSKIADLAKVVRQEKSKTDNFTFGNPVHLASLIEGIKYDSALTKLGCKVVNHARAPENGENTKERFFEELTPHARDSGNVYKISWWIALWPFALLDLVFNRIIRNIGQYAAAVFDGVFGGLAKKILSRGIGEN